MDCIRVESSLISSIAFRFAFLSLINSCAFRWSLALTCCDLGSSLCRPFGSVFDCLFFFCCLSAVFAGLEVKSSSKSSSYSFALFVILPATATGTMAGGMTVATVGSMTGIIAGGATGAGTLADVTVKGGVKRWVQGA